MATSRSTNVPPPGVEAGNFIRSSGFLAPTIQRSTIYERRFTRHRRGYLEHRQRRAKDKP